MPANLLAIETALKNIPSIDLRAAATNLLAALGYTSQRVVRLTNPTSDGFVQQFDIKPDEFNPTKALAAQWEQFEFLFQLTEQEVRRTLTLFNQIEAGNKDSFFFHALKLNLRNDETGRSKPYTRTELAEITRQLNRPFGVPTVVFIQHDGQLTIGVISRRTNKRDATRDVLEKVSLIKDISLTHPHPAHLRILGQLSLDNLPAWHFEDVLKCWATTLDIRELNNKFYKELSAWYYIATSTIKLPIKAPYHANDAENVQHFTVRLICRTLFCWFLKEKGLIDRRLLELYDLRDVPTDLLPDTQSAGFANQNSYYRGVLQNIFFTCLNQPMGRGRAGQYLGKRYLPNSFDYSLFDRVPYLNGGLFDKLYEDNADDRTDDGPISVPNSLFYGTELTAGIGRYQVRTQGLNRILSSYKFTVTENTPLEEEVALDPELLGMVFENLLAETDPDETTAKTARKASGSFYTPRQVIDYMVNESLVLYLNSAADRQGVDTATTKQAITNLIYNNQVTPNTTFANLVVDAFDELKILDPACGSGAFPMGMLNRVVQLLRLVDPGNQHWISKQLQRLPAEIREQARRDFARHDFNYARKLGLIRNAIYGLDILPMASVITKLRFFISLLIEQDVDLTAPANNYNISPLPNLETKIICANSLNDIAPSVFDQAVIDQLEAAREQYYDRNRTAAEKSQIADQLAEYLDTLYPYEQFGFAIRKERIADANTKRLANRQLLREWFQHGNLSAPFFNLPAFFPELRGRGFDIVIGNPPYGGTPVTDTVKTALGLGSKDPYGAFISRFLGDGLRATPLRDGGVLAFIVSDTFMTIKSHLPLRKQMVNHYLHKMVRVHPDTFSATVNTAIVFVQKHNRTNPRQTPAPLRQSSASSTLQTHVPGRQLDLNGRAQAVQTSLIPSLDSSTANGTQTAIQAHTVLMADLTNVSIHDHYDRFLELLHQTTSDATGTLPQPTPEYAIYQYPQHLITTNSNLPFFVASPKLFALMNDINAPRRDVVIGDQTIQARVIRLNEINVPVVKLGQIAEVKQGLATGDNDAYLFQNPVARGTYRSIEDYRQFLLTDADLQRISNDDRLRLAVIEQGISKNDVQSERYFGGRYVVPFDKGGESDSESGWMPNFYIPTGYFIDWSEQARTRIDSYTISERMIANNERGKILAHYYTTNCAVIRNPHLYFKKGITFSPTGVYSPTFRENSNAIFGNKGSCIFFDYEEINVESALGIVSSKAYKFLIKNFQSHTVEAPEGQLVETPFVLDSSSQITTLVTQIITKQKVDPRYDYASHEQIEIDRLVYEAYGLNADDIREVETWYARRYPKLAQAQARNRVAVVQAAEQTNSLPANTTA
jgi:hypothetical protein